MKNFVHFILVSACLTAFTFSCAKDKHEPSDAPNTPTTYQKTIKPSPPKNKNEIITTDEDDCKNKNGAWDPSYQTCTIKK